MIKAIIFDCFGVLVGRGFAETYRLAGGDPVADAEFINDMLARESRDMLAAGEFRQAMADKLQISVEAFAQAEADAEQPDHDLLDYIAELHADYKIAILSNAGRGTVEQRLPDESLVHHFDALIVSAEVNMMKPDEEIYLLAARQLAVEPSECVFTDDQPRYAQAARQAGMQAIAYSSLSQFKAELQQILAK